MNCPPLLALAEPRRANQGDHFWRLAQPFARLREAGFIADIGWLAEDGMPDINPRGRIVLIQRTSFAETNPVTGMLSVDQDQVTAWVQRLREAGALAVVAELDDDTLSPSYMTWLDASGGLEMVKRQRLLCEQQAWRYAVMAADAVTVSTEHLANVARQHTAAPVYVVPNAIDAEWFTSRLRVLVPWGKHTTLGWAGGRRPDADLEPMAVAWGRIAARYPDVRFVVAGWQPDCIYREVEDIDRIIRIPWQDLDDYPKAMQVSIGCTPLADTPFNRCKSPIKAWEYALAGAAVVGMDALYGDCLAHGGYIAETTDDWEHALAFLIERDEVRRTAADDLREHVKLNHSMSTQLARWPAAYAQIADGARAPA